jgi:hypothetical protein
MRGGSAHRAGPRPAPDADKQAHRAVTKLSFGVGDLIGWHGQGWNRIDTLAFNAQRFPAGGEDTQVRRAMQQRPAMRATRSISDGHCCQASAVAIAGNIKSGSATVVIMLVLPPINEGPSEFSAVVLWRFRLATPGIEVVLWATGTAARLSGDHQGRLRDGVGGFAEPRERRSRWKSGRVPPTVSCLSNRATEKPCVALCWRESRPDRDGPRNLRRSANESIRGLRHLIITS